MADEIRWNGEIQVANVEYAKTAGIRVQTADQTLQGDSAGMYDLTTSDTDLDPVLGALTSAGITLVENLSLAADGAGDVLIQFNTVAFMRLKPGEKFIFRFPVGITLVSAKANGGDSTARLQITVWED